MKFLSFHLLGCETISLFKCILVKYFICLFGQFSAGCYLCALVNVLRLFSMSVLCVFPWKKAQTPPLLFKFLLSLCLSVTLLYDHSNESYEEALSCGMFTLLSKSCSTVVVKTCFILQRVSSNLRRLFQGFLQVNSKRQYL